MDRRIEERTGRTDRRHLPRATARRPSASSSSRRRAPLAGSAAPGRRGRRRRLRAPATRGRSCRRARSPSGCGAISSAILARDARADGSRPLAGNRDIMRALLAEREPSYRHGRRDGGRLGRNAPRGGRPDRGAARGRNTEENVRAAMRYLILSDIHANCEALSAVLAHVRRKRWDKAVVLGDVVGYGANPNQAVDMVRELKPLVAIRGNHDKVCSGIEDGEMFNRVALQAAMWTRRSSRPRTCAGCSRLPEGPAVVDGTFAVAPRHADRRGRLHLRRDRGAERVPADGVPALLLRALALPRDLRPLARRDPDRPHRSRRPSASGSSRACATW